MQLFLSFQFNVDPKIGSGDVPNILNSGFRMKYVTKDMVTSPVIKKPEEVLKDIPRKKTPTDHIDFVLRTAEGRII